MKPIRRAFLLIFCFSLTFGSFSQSDTACVSKRWIAVKNTEHNAVLFEKPRSILRTIRELVEAKKVWLYHSESSTFNERDWYPIPENYPTEYQSDYINYLVESDEFFKITIQSDVHLVDDYGDPIIIEDSTGSWIYKYDDPEIHLLNLNDLVEMRIREERTFNEEDSVFEGDFRPTGISFFIKNDFEARELFWVDLDELMSKIERTYPWQSFIQNKEYAGFQYLQVSCYDDQIRY